MKRAYGGNRVRIIAGSWRGRCLELPLVEGLRPTGDRIRETLFNWLAPRLPGARCLDLFAGSGALGFEAASRGAGQVVMVERDRAACRTLRQSIAQLGAQQVYLCEQSALAYLAGSVDAEAFDLVFLDPPFGGDLLARAHRALRDGGRLRDGALVYVEQPAASGIDLTPWQVYRERVQGSVRFALYRADLAG